MYWFTFKCFGSQFSVLENHCKQYTKAWAIFIHLLKEPNISEKHNFTFRRTLVVIIEDILRLLILRNVRKNKMLWRNMRLQKCLKLNWAISPFRDREFYGYVQLNALEKNHFRNYSFVFQIIQNQARKRYLRSSNVRMGQMWIWTVRKQKKK